ncbi:hypothetical protein L6V77_25190 [Myxococcota bacterium]|nr:hypothetical protein [Myxococcota bacterium]
MTDLKYWQQKLVCLFHDPPGKQWAMHSGTGGHETLARALLEDVLGVLPPGPRGGDFRFFLKHPDHMASGADRAVLTPAEGTRPSVLTYRDAADALFQHPLAAGARIRLTRRDGTFPAPPDMARGAAMQSAQVDTAEKLLDDRPLTGAFQDEASLKKAHRRAWRRWPADLQRDTSNPESATTETIWALAPADSRQPDHTIWDHLRLTSAFAFASAKFDAPNEANAAWLLSASLSPVQGFITQARTSRDLWLGSYLLAELSWAAMRAVAGLLGADQIMHPDLRGNPRVDRWLSRDDPGAVPASVVDPASYASLLPHKFVAIVPRHLLVDSTNPEAPALIKACSEAVEKRWQYLAGTVRRWLTETLANDFEPALWMSAFDAQVQSCPLSLTWAAAPLIRTRVVAPQSHGSALLTARQGPPTSTAEETHAEARRRSRLEPWLPGEAWANHENLRTFYARINTEYVRNGLFDYGPIHHQVAVRHALRRRQLPPPVLPPAHGEKCTLCGERSALGAPAGPRQGSLDAQRSDVRAFWQHPKLDPEAAGAERLCAVCTTRRFLVDASTEPLARDADDGSLPVRILFSGTRAELPGGPVGQIRVPFPSTATVAAQDFLVSVVSDASLAGARDAVVRAHDLAFPRGAGRTNFPRALRRLAEVAHLGGDFLQLDTQTSIFPEAIEGLIAKASASPSSRPGANPGALRALHAAVRALRAEAASREIRPPGKRIAVIKVDGDRIGGKILGDPDATGIRVEEILHPKAKAALEALPVAKDQQLGVLWRLWRGGGPALQAFISRAMADFAHRIVPWVVEREFGGRLVYCGGDDALILAPADEALFITRRLQQVFSAAWVVDTRPEVDAWDWRAGAWVPTKGEVGDGGEALAAQRLWVVPASEGEITLPVDPARVAVPVRRPPTEKASAPVPRPAQPINGRLLPMLGPNASLSGGIVFAHYKANLGAAIRRASDLLERVAKGQAERAALALTHWTRGGEKGHAAFKWDDFDAFQQILEGFKRGNVAGRLPYKLAEATAYLSVSDFDAEADVPAEAGRVSPAAPSLAAGLIRQAWDGRVDDTLLASLLRIWGAGRRLAGAEASPRVALGGLFVARSLAGEDDDDDGGEADGATGGDA